MAKILVVDDDRMILQLITYNLESDGHRVIQARDGERGFQCFLEHYPDLVLLDVMMPI
ncbi:MAG: response regulator, partial [Chloroflexota bacterium]